MASNKESTLRINDFKGISRYYNSMNQPPEKWWTMQNVYSPTKGELALIGGVTDITGTGYPGATSIKHIDFLKTAVGYERVLVFFDHAALTAPSAPTAVAVAGTGYSGNVDVAISWVGMGGESALSTATTVATGAGGNIQVTVPTFPTGIVSMNVFANGGLAAIVSKRMGGSLPATVTLDISPKTLAAAGGEARITVKDFSLTFGTSGNLQSGRTYFFGVMPNLRSDAAGDGVSALVTTNCGQTTAPIGVTRPSGRIFSFTVPSGYNSVAISFTTTAARKLIEMRANSAPYEWTENTTDTTGLSAWAFLGTSVDDLMAASASTDGTIKPKAFSSSTALDVEFREVPYNSNITTYRQGRTSNPTATDYSDIYNFIDLRAGTLWKYYYYENAGGLQSSELSPANSGLGIYAQTALTYSDSTAYQIMPARGCGYYTNNRLGYPNYQVLSFTSVFIPFSSGQLRVENYDLSSAGYLNRLYFANGEQTPFSTNGYVLSNAPRKVNTPYLPITKTIRTFNQRLVLAGGDNTLFNTQNVVYYSASADPQTWTDSPAAGAALAFITALDADSDVLVGLGVYSETLSQSGNNAFLVIGKTRSCYTWNGVVGTGAQQVAERTGFASKNAFALTNYGAVFVGRENVYRMTGNGQAQKIGNDVESILKGLTDTQIQTVTARFQDSHLKIGYQGLVDTDPRNIDQELWLNIRQDGGELFPVFTGPHLMKTYTEHTAINSFGSAREVRISFLGTKLYKRDDYTSYLNDGTSIPVYWESNDIGFGADEFAKIVTQLMIRAKISKAESLTLGIVMYDSASQGKGLDYTGDGKQTYSVSMALPYSGSGTIYRNFPKQFSERYRGDLLRFSLALSTNVDFKVQSMNWLFNVDRRRLL